MDDAICDRQQPVHGYKSGLYSVLQMSGRIGKFDHVCLDLPNTVESKVTVLGWLLELWSKVTPMIIAMNLAKWWIKPPVF